jgi:hypothetical protein
VDNHTDAQEWAFAVITARLGEVTVQELDGASDHMVHLFRQALRVGDDEWVDRAIASVVDVAVRSIRILAEGEGISPESFWSATLAEKFRTA